MKFQLKQLPYQLQALDAVMNNFEGIDKTAPESENPEDSFANPLIKKRYKEKSNIDIKMETGTGKTYVGTQAIYKLHEEFGLFKFIIVVPSPAIKEGWKNFLTAKYSKEHFNDIYKNVKLDVSVINAGDFKAKSGRKYMPAHLVDFIEGSRQNNNTINVLLINDDMLRSKSMKNEYDQSLLAGYTSPIDGLKATKPIVILDEPHRFPRKLEKEKWVGKKNYAAVEALKAQKIIRFGATFNYDKKTEKRDYYRGAPQFNLNAVESFNRDLVKAVDIYYPSIGEDDYNNKYQVKNVNNKQLVLKKGNRTYSPLGVGDDLSIIDNNFKGNITYAGNKKLSNDLELGPGLSLIPGTFSQSYQEMIIYQAIEKHFEKEKENFFRPKGKIKTLSLFFIDKIDSYFLREYEGKGRKAGWLSQIFDELLNKKINIELSKLDLKNSLEKEYHDFLLATKKDISSSRGAYFGSDQFSNDEVIQKEIDDILRNKEKLLSFKDSDGNWNTRRFLFSKWTLREGWDNPNVFVIAKLRSSGSENSKIQEVGRGLRLPVDEFGNRISDEKFRLAFIIGYDEKDFAKKLVEDINKDVTFKINEEKLTDDTIQVILESQPNLDEETLLEQLDKLNIIKRNNEFKENGVDKLRELYPILNTEVKKDKITSNNNNPTKKLKLNKENWSELKSIWEELSKRYMVVFNRMTKQQWESLLEDMLLNYGQDIFKIEYSESMQQKLIFNENEARVDEKPSPYKYKKIIGTMKYGKFIETLSRRTKLPIDLLIRVITNYLSLEFMTDNDRNVTDYFNNRSINNFVIKFEKIFEDRFENSITYDALKFEAKTSIWNTQTHDFVDEITASYVGELEEANEVTDKDRALYYEPPLRFDSRIPELELLKYGYSQAVIVFGKIPKKAIKIPKYTGGSTTPDFIYKIGNSLYLFVETKSNDLRNSEYKAINIQERFLNQFGNVHYKVATEVQDVINELEKLQKTINQRNLRCE